jgi:glyoxylase-like metal-dependent hydrolase (beta-lactamase superfamily II)
MSQLAITVVPVTLFEQNCSLVWNSETKEGVVVDPGGDLARIRAAIEEKRVTVDKILLTHGHIDHAGGAAELAAELGVPIEGPHQADAFLLERLAQAGAAYGITGARPVTPTRWLEEGDRVTIGGSEFEVLHCPGHSPGSVVFFSRELGFALMGDVLFRGSVGRSDIPGGDHATLISSIKSKLVPLGDEVSFLPGHGPASTIGEERRSNPFLVGE